MTLPIIQSLWGCEPGEKLSNLERLSIQSFLDNGHEYHLYLYFDVPDMPAGVIVKDANEILPAAKIFKYHNWAFAPFADWWRYQMLYIKGGFWADLDLVCIKPFAFDDEIVLNHQYYDRKPTCRFANFAFGFPQGHPCMQELADQCAAHGKVKDYMEFYWLFNQAIKKHKLEQHAKPPHCFYFPDHPCLDFYPNGIDLPSGTHAVHIAKSILLKFNKLDRNDRFHPHCIYELLKAKHGIKNNPDAKLITPQTIEQAHENRAAGVKADRRKKRLFIAAIALAVGLALGLLVGQQT